MPRQKNHYKNEGTIVLSTNYLIYNQNYAVSRILYDANAAGYPALN